MTVFLLRTIFGVKEGGEYVYLYRRRFADNDPIVTLETFLPYDQCAFVFSHNFSEESLYNVLALRDKTRICRVKRVLEAVAANGQDVETLNVHRGKPIMLVAVVGYNSADEPVEYSIARYRGDSIRFDMDLLVDARA